MVEAKDADAHSKSTVIGRANKLVRNAVKVFSVHLPAFVMFGVTVLGPALAMHGAQAIMNSIPPAQGAAVLGCATSATNVWDGYSFAPQTGTFTVSFDASPNAAVTDAVVGLSSSLPNGYEDLAAIVRFSSTSHAIDARNGSAYSAAGTIPYVVGTTYHFRMVVNAAAHTYSAYVAPAGQGEKLIGTNYKFRTEQAASGALEYWSPFSEIGTVSVCNWSVATGSNSIATNVTLAAADTASPSVPQGLTATAVNSTEIKVSWNDSSDNVGVAGYRVFQDGNFVVTTRNLNSFYTISGLVAPTTHKYTVSAYDAAGNSSAQSAPVVGTIAKASTIPATPNPLPPSPPTGGTGGSTGTYDATVLADHPVAFWDVNPKSGTEADLSGHANTGTYKNGTPTAATMPNGDRAADFNGAQYLTVPSSASFSIPTTGSLTWEAWVRPDTLQFAKVTSDNYADFMGKCDQYGPTCEWESRMYNSTTPENRGSRLSAYVFNPSAGLGSAADWQPNAGVISAGQWLHVVVEYTTASSPSGCANTATYPGSINIWVNGVLWSQSSHAPTGCMSQYSVKPKALSSPLTIGTMAFDSWFQGAVGKVAIYNYRLSQTEINAHYKAMTGKTPVGSCGATCSL